MNDAVESDCELSISSLQEKYRKFFYFTEIVSQRHIRLIQESEQHGLEINGQQVTFPLFAAHDTWTFHR